ncbi:MAG: DUF2325 domain-containing protein [Lautropia sp.]|nr:DUF2325 domain-containing protein [Lautropia sp.]
MKTSQTPPQCALNELKALRLAYGDAQRRCTEQLVQLHRRNQVLETEVMRLRARLIARDTMAMWAREDLAGEWTSAKGSSRGASFLVSRIVSLTALVQTLLRMLVRGHEARADEVAVPVAPPQRGGEAGMIPVNAASSPAVNDGGEPIESAYDIPDLEKRLVEADLVICQTGCLSHDAYWRMQDHCRRLNKPCVLVAQPDALRIVRIHNRGEAVTASETAGSDAV